MKIVYCSCIENVFSLISDPPKVKISLGKSLKPSLIKEGDDVYFACEVSANPSPTSITWYHEVNGDS